ncbi:gp54 [Listeria phage P40]|uniref:gp54 n=1 Tax=Listeria phage P40 TaxID=560178 RepID=UPI0001819903|nr:gp54 [Listeria phage P40]ACI00414.1 gp54 [Listeria phage P40]
MKINCEELSPVQSYLESELQQYQNEQKLDPITVALEVNVINDTRNYTGKVLVMSAHEMLLRTTDMAEIHTLLREIIGGDNIDY